MTQVRTFATAALLLGLGAALAGPAPAQPMGGGGSVCQTVNAENKAFCDLFEAQRASTRAAALRAAAVSADQAVNPTARRGRNGPQPVSETSAQDRVRDRPPSSPNCPAPTKGRSCRTF